MGQRAVDSRGAGQSIGRTRSFGHGTRNRASNDGRVIGTSDRHGHDSGRDLRSVPYRNMKRLGRATLQPFDGCFIGHELVGASGAVQIKRAVGVAALDVEGLKGADRTAIDVKGQFIRCVEVFKPKSAGLRGKAVVARRVHNAQLQRFQRRSIVRPGEGDGYILKRAVVCVDA